MLEMMIEREIQRQNQVSNSLKHLTWYNKDHNVCSIHKEKRYWCAKKAFDLVTKDMFVADFGCLDGSVTYALSKLCKRAYGFDLPEVIEKGLYEPAENLRYFGVDLDEGFYVPDISDPYNTLTQRGRYDMILAMDIVEHLYNDLDFLKNCAKYLSPDGIILISTPLSPTGEVSQHPSRQSHFREYTKWQLSMLVNDAGIVINDYYIEVEPGQPIETIHLLGRKHDNN